MTTPPDGRLPPLTDGRVRSFKVRQGKLSALTLERLSRLWPERDLPPGPVDPQAVFGRDAPLVVEVGCGHGAAAIEYASTHPEHDVIAIDMHLPGLARMLAAADAAGVANLRVSRGDAVELLADRLEPGRLAAVHLFFPDPWPKSKHVKRRFVTAQTLDLIASRLAPGGHLLVATDQPAYAEHVVGRARRRGGLEVAVVGRPPWRPLDGFEVKGLHAGRQIIDLRLTRG
ncbi:MAG: tRNA (guanosine(46)-N7)-methyltransferase TrmB [Lapillicoccus sp.]